MTNNCHRTDFFEKYTPKKPNGELMYKTTGRDFLDVAYKATPNTTWTVLDIDGTHVVVPGFKYHSLMVGYIVTEQAWEDNNETFKL